MTQEIAEPEIKAQTEEQRDDIRTSLTRLIADGRAYAEAEVEKQKLRAAIVGGAVRDAAILGVVAMTLLFAAFIALLVGLIFIFAPMIGVGWAVVAVVGGAFLISIILLLIAKSRISQMKQALRP